jgi:glycosyltransferase involved in cell wall biosynthesis
MIQGGRNGRLFGVLVTFNRPQALAETLRLVAGQERPPDLLVVVDNAPTKEGRALVEGIRGVPVEYVPTAENLGFAGGVAVGMRRILEGADEDDWIVVLDDDDPPDDPSALAELERFGSAMRNRDPRTAGVGLVGARFDWRRGRMMRVPDGELGGPVPVDFIGGGHLPLLRVRAIREVGPFSPDIFFGLSEVEHGLRLKRAGWSIYAQGTLWRDRRERAGRLGLDGRPSRRLAEPTWRRYYSLRNAIHILRSFGHPGTALRITLLQGVGKPLANMVVEPGPAWRHLRINLRACRDGWTGRMGRTIDPGAIP